MRENIHRGKRCQSAGWNQVHSQSQNNTDCLQKENKHYSQNQ